MTSTSAQGCRGDMNTGGLQTLRAVSHSKFIFIRTLYAVLELELEGV